MTARTFNTKDLGIFQTKRARKELDFSFSWFRYSFFLGGSLIKHLNDNRIHRSLWLGSTGSSHNSVVSEVGSQGSEISEGLWTISGNSRQLQVTLKIWSGHKKWSWISSFYVYSLSVGVCHHEDLPIALPVRNTQGKHSMVPPLWPWKCCKASTFIFELGPLYQVSEFHCISKD